MTSPKSQDSARAQRAQSLFRLRGDLQIDVRHADGSRPKRTYAIRNTIVYDGLNSPLYLWTQDTGTPTDWRMVKLVAGTNGVPPSVGDVGLGAPLPDPLDEMPLTLANRSVVPALGELVITVGLSLTQANGQDLKEVGIFMGSGLLFARQIHPTITKNGAITVTYTWRIAVTS